VQQASQTSAAAAVNKQGVRLSAGSDCMANSFAGTMTLAAEFGNVEGKSRIRFELHVH
jgi:cysteine sulfinate desulfinase/cysteine desulfurase-like protein